MDFDNKRAARKVYIKEAMLFQQYTELWVDGKPLNTAKAHKYFKLKKGEL